MTEIKTHHHAARNRKKASVPLSKLRPSDVVKTVLDNPRRLEELLDMLEDKDRGMRGRAAATLARLSESHPARISRVAPRIKECLGDDSAYVRWHVVYAFGQISARFHACSREFLPDVIARLDDSNRIVRIIASKVLAKIADRHASIIEEAFLNLKREMPQAIARLVKKAHKYSGSKA